MAVLKITAQNFEQEVLQSKAGTGRFLCGLVRSM